MITHTPEQSDENIVTASLNNPEAYTGIITKYYSLLDRYIQRLGISTIEDREDVLQEIFLKTYLNLNAYDDSLKFSSWIYRIAHNETITFFRKTSARPKTTFVEDYTEFEAFIIDPCDMVSIFDTRQSQLHLIEKINLLDTKYRDVLILNYFEDKHYNEIADILKKPPNTIATLLSRAKTKLKLLLINPPTHE